MNLITMLYSIVNFIQAHPTSSFQAGVLILLVVIARRLGRIARLLVTLERQGKQTVVTVDHSRYNLAWFNRRQRSLRPALARVANGGGLRDAMRTSSAQAGRTDLGNGGFSDQSGMRSTRTPDCPG